MKKLFKPQILTHGSSYIKSLPRTSVYMKRDVLVQLFDYGICHTLGLFPCMTPHVLF